MTSYRCYVLDKKIGFHLAPPRKLPTTPKLLSKAALKIRMSLIFPIIEMWQGKRLIGRVPQRDHIKD